MTLNDRNSASILTLNGGFKMNKIIKLIERRLSDLNTRGKTISVEEDFLKELLSEINWEKNLLECSK